MKSKFKIGDRVRMTKECDGRFPKCCGTIKYAYHSYPSYAVEFDENMYGHDCMGRVEFGRGWDVREDCLELCGDDRKIVITTDGKTTLARLYEGNKVIKKAEAKRAPDDVFDFDTGARIAFDRLISKPFTKSDLQDGDIVVKRNGSVEMLFEDGFVLLGENVGFNEIEVINDDLTHRIDKKFDIVEVYRPTHASQRSKAGYKYAKCVYKRKSK